MGRLRYSVSPERPSFATPEWLKLTERDPDIWFEEGSIVIVAQHTGFRVHKQLLSSISPVFQALFKPAGIRRKPIVSLFNGHCVVKGPPVIHVSDSAYDMKCTLRALYDGQKYLNGLSPFIPFSVLSALMRLGHKYQLQDIIDDAARRLEDYFTTDFGVWLQYCREEKDETFDFSEDEGADVFEAVNLTRLTGKVSILPLALYKCCQQDVAAIMFGIRRKNGNVVHLCQEDVERCVRARDRLFRESCKMIDTVTGALAERAPRCVTRSACSRQMEVLVEAFTAMFATLINTDALSGPEEQLGSLATLSEWTQLCAACREELVRQHVEKQRETWGSLLKILDLEHRSLTYRWSGLISRK